MLVFIKKVQYCLIKLRNDESIATMPCATAKAKAAHGRVALKCLITNVEINSGAWPLLSFGEETER